MYLICFICLASYLKGNKMHNIITVFISVIVFTKCLKTILLLGILPLVLSGDVYIPTGLNRVVRSTETQNLKPVASTAGTVNQEQENNKSQIVLLTESSPEFNESFVLKEQYELQNETGFKFINYL